MLSGLNYVKAVVLSPYGKIEITYKLEENGEITTQVIKPNEIEVV